MLKLQVAGVGVDPLPLTVPVPSTLRNLELWETILDDVRSKVKPPTLHRAGCDPELKVQGAVIVTAVPKAMPLKLPLELVTNEVFQVLTCVAAARDVESSVTTPPKVMSPVTGAPSGGIGEMGMACACWQKRPQLNRPIASTVRIVLLRFFMGLFFVSLSRIGTF